LFVQLCRLYGYVSTFRDILCMANISPGILHYSSRNILLYSLGLRT
jgi:hypothetical protein